MAKSPKILEVTFGTFSCRLEGFEEPVEALMAVAEYLRDLAGRDPGFGTRAGAPAGGGPAAWTAPGTGSAEPPARREEAAVPVLSEAPRGGAVPPATEPAGHPPADEPGAEDEADAMAEPEPDPASPGLQRLLAAAASGEEAVTRILSQTDDQLADPEAARRREVIARLRAAVAATEAERALGEPSLDPEARVGAFRLDLREAVREPSASEGERSHPTPLRLVASQRVDLPEAAAQEEPRPAEPPGPREEMAEARQESFPAFATEMGAGTLPDVLEAAAAWLCFVEEAEDVSRGQLLGLAAEALPAPPDREEGLRAFGTLLRQGRIAASAGGRYRVSPGSRFNPGRLAG